MVATILGQIELAVENKSLRLGWSVFLAAEWQLPFDVTYAVIAWVSWLVPLAIVRSWPGPVDRLIADWPRRPLPFATS